MKFVLLVEGSTEKNSIADLLKRWLDPQLKKPVGIQVVSFGGFADLERKMIDRAKHHLASPSQSEIVGVIGLMDLYGPNFYPPDKTTTKER